MSAASTSKPAPAPLRTCHGLILFAHGARDPAWAQPLHELARLVAERNSALAVRVAFLELQPPGLSAALDELAATCTHITVLPVFWAAAGHVANELPALLASARTRHPALTFKVLPPLSELPGLLAFVADAAVAALS